MAQQSVGAKKRRKRATARVGLQFGKLVRGRTGVTRSTGILVVTEVVPAARIAAGLDAGGGPRLKCARVRMG